MEREEITTRIDDWEHRLNKLMETLRRWYDALPDAQYKKFLEGSVLQVTEGMMREHNIHPRMLPHCAILFDENTLNFIPGPLWVLGSNGRAYLSTDKRQFVLIDLGGKDGNPSEWHVITSHTSNTYRPFTEEMFREIVFRQDIAA